MTIDGTSQMPDSPALDLDVIHARYRTERERRLARTSDARQYRALDGRFAPTLDDPYGDIVARDAVREDIDVFVVGGGFGGLLTGARLHEAGIDAVRIAESGSDFGGTWYWNRYPGAACDIESYIYLPMLEETGYMPVERYSKSEEIRAHARRIAERYDLYRAALFSTQVTKLTWQADLARWRVETDRGDILNARFVVLSTGPLNKPKLPDIPGLETFAGHAFHTSRWDYGYTGGSATEPLTGLANKRVGIIGTGATAIQCVPPLARDAAHLDVFQRTPSAVDPRDNSVTDPTWWASLEPGWQKARTENFSAQFVADLPPDDLVRDGWTVTARMMRGKVAANIGSLDYAALHDLADAEKMAWTRSRVDEVIDDPAVAEGLKAWYSVYCKRPCFSDQYLQAFNRNNVTLVETAGSGIDRITPTGVVVNGKDYPLDCLIFATGFDTSSTYATRAGMSVSGVDGQSLSDKWANGVSTFHGLHTRGFPNLFVISQVQSGMSPNFPHMLSEQTTHLAHIVTHCLDRDIATVEPTVDAEADWVRSIVEATIARRSIFENCTPGYYNNEGRPSLSGARSGVFGAGPIAFARLLKAWRDKGDFAGLELGGTPVNSLQRTDA